MKKPMISNEVEEQVIEAVNYIANIVKKQGFMPPLKMVYGDGSRWKIIGFKWFEIAYKAVEEKYSADMQNIIIRGLVDNEMDDLLEKHVN